jgi:hypothetical protein
MYTLPTLSTVTPKPYSTSGVPSCRVQSRAPEASYLAKKASVDPTLGPPRLP